MPNTFFFIIFLMIVISVYSLMNYYFLRKHRNVISGKSLPIILWRLVLFTLVLTPILTIIFSRNGVAPAVTKIGSLIGYSWLAFLFLFLSIHVIADITIFILEKKKKVRPTNQLAKTMFWVTIGLSLAIIFYGRFEASNIQTKHITIQTKKLSGKNEKIKIVQISDVHFSALTGAETAKKIARLIEKEKPDILVCTGDLLDPGIEDEKEIIRTLNSIQAPQGKFAVTGNHEFFAGIPKSTQFINDSGFKLLRDDSVTLEKLNIVGVDDPSRHFGQRKSEKKAFKNIDPEKFTILLKHQPKVDQDTLQYFDLQLSGHSHGGQIFPFSLLAKIEIDYLAGLYELSWDKQIYVNRGAGTWGPPIRFLAPPEITVIEVVSC